MESVTGNPPLVVVLGQTATGKSALTLRLAQQFSGEIIAADSRTIYRGMDIGTAKPNAAEQKLVRHHLIDIVNPDERFTVADFQKLVQQAIADIASRGKVPFLVGGSGLYIDAVIYDFTFRLIVDFAERQKLSALSATELLAAIKERGIELPSDQQNPRRLVRALETGGAVSKKTSLRPNTLVIGLSKEKDELETVVMARVEAMVKGGLVDEVRRLSERYGWDVPALQAPGYRAFRRYFAGNLNLDEAKQEFIQRDLQYAKRQKTWFKRNPDIVWISNPAEAVDLVTTFLNK